jgi:hypothetical protein
MFECLVELVSNLNENIDEHTCIVVGKYNFDPGLKEGDKLFIVLPLWGKNYKSKAVVLQRKFEIYGSSIKLMSLYGEAAKEGLFRLRIFIEAEDRGCIPVL